MPADGDIDYRALSRAQLLEAQSNIDAARFPRNHANLLQELARRQQPGYVDETATHEPPVAQPNPFPSLVLDPVTLDRRYKWLRGVGVAIVCGGIITSQAYRPMLLTGSLVATAALPVLLGLACALVVGRLLLGTQTTQLPARRGSANLTVSRWLLTIVGTAIVAGGLVGLVGLQGILLAGSMTSGPTRKADAVVMEIKKGHRRERCRQLVTVAMDDGQRATLCAQPRWRSDIIPYGIAVGERVSIEVTRNVTGEWVTNVSKMVRRPN